MVQCTASQWNDLVGDPRVDCGNDPKVLDPSNPTNNAVRGFRHWVDIREYARESLVMILNSEEPIPAQLQTAAASSSGSNTVSKEVEEEFKQLGLSLNFAVKWKAALGCYSASPAARSMNAVTVRTSDRSRPVCIGLTTQRRMVCS